VLGTSVYLLKETCDAFYKSSITLARKRGHIKSTASKSIKENTNNCLHTPYRSTFTVVSRGFPATARLSR